MKQSYNFINTALNANHKETVRQHTLILHCSAKLQLNNPQHKLYTSLTLPCSVSRVSVCGCLSANGVVGGTSTRVQWLGVRLALIRFFSNVFLLFFTFVITSGQMEKCCPSLGISQFMERTEDKVHCHQT